MSGIVATGAGFLCGAFVVAHAPFDARIGGDWVDPLLYSGGALLVVRFVVIVLRLALPDGTPKGHAGSRVTRERSSSRRG